MNDSVDGTPDDDGQTPLDPDEARGLLPAWIANRGDLNIAEEKNIAEGMQWGARAVKRQAVLSQDFLRRLHGRMFGNVWAWAARYRDTERNIGVPPHAISMELENLMSDAMAWDEFTSYPIDERAVRLHHRLTHIHPFPNGNGRCSRVLADLYLEQRSTRKFSWGSGLPGTTQRPAYLAALRQADTHDYGPLLGFVRS